MIGRIKGIIGDISDSYVDEKGVFHHGTTLLDVIEQVESLPKTTTVIEIPVNSPGGYVDIGNSIYDYLVSLKKTGKQIVTIQTGLVGSIATKIFLAGDRRIVDDRYEFWIHNPFVTGAEGDQDQLRMKADELAQTEKDLRKFYSDFTSITDEGLDGLMKNETGLTADQCIKFNFGTEKKLVPVFNSIKPNNKKMAEKKDEKGLLEYLQAYFTGGKHKDDKKGVQPKAAKPGNDAKSLVVNLADNGGSFWVEADAVAEGVSAFLLDANGQPTAEPLADGDYTLEDGSMLSVAGGLVTKVTPAEAAAVDPITMTQAEFDTAVAAAVDKAMTESKAAVEELKDEVLNFKKNVKLGIQPKKGVITQQKVEIKGIAAILKEKEKARQEHILNRK